MLSQVDRRAAFEFLKEETILCRVSGVICAFFPQGIKEREKMGCQNTKQQTADKGVQFRQFKTFKEEEKKPVKMKVNIREQNDVWVKLKEKLCLEKTPEQEQKRKALFSQFDPNGNGYLSLAEVDCGCRKILHLDDLTDDLAPILMRAFTSAKDAVKGKGKDAKTRDDYVEHSEFRLLLCYIRDYFELWAMYEAIDTSGDRRLTLDEFKQAAPKIEKWGLKMENPEKSFKEIDANNGGFILFIEFADWAINRHLDLDTDDDNAAPAPPPPKEDCGQKK